MWVFGLDESAEEGGGDEKEEGTLLDKDKIKRKKWVEKQYEGWLELELPSPGDYRENELLTREFLEEAEDVDEDDELEESDDEKEVDPPFIGCGETFNARHKQDI